MPDIALEATRRAIRLAWRGVAWTAALFLGGWLSCAGPAPEGLLERLYRGDTHLANVDTEALRGRRILIDPGHGGSFAGSRGAADTKEADVNLGVGLYLWGLLRDAGADVHLTRASDRDLLRQAGEPLRDDLQARVSLIDSLQPEVFLSLHHNSNAELDRRRNAIETYYKLDDEGPSYDLAGAIHAQLAAHLGIEKTSIRPGNFFVLRNSSSAAVLGEASYLSNPHVEERLQLAAAQKLEAEAYFLGLLQYFSNGVPSLALLNARSDSLRADQVLRFELSDSKGAIDPASVRLWIDAVPVPALYQTTSSTLTYALENLDAGAHTYRLQARNLRGNAAQPLTGNFWISSPPARLSLTQEPSIAAADGMLRLRLAVEDERGRSVADGLTVTWQFHRGQLVAAETVTRSGIASAIVQLQDGAPGPGPLESANSQAQRLDVECQVGGLRRAYALRLDDDATAVRFVQIRDRLSQEGVAGQLVVCPHSGRVSDRNGWVRLPDACELNINVPGYQTWRQAAPESGAIELSPRYAGAFQGRRIVLDPAGTGLEDRRAPTASHPAEVNHRVCRYLQRMLERAGAEAPLTRGVSHEVSTLERIQLASSVPADYFLRLDLGSKSSVPRLLHYPNSETGEIWARQSQIPLQEFLAADSLSRGTDTQAVLQQTPCPALVFEGTAEHPEWPPEFYERRLAYALFLGIERLLYSDSRTFPHWEATLQAWALSDASGAVAMLDDLATQPLDASGRIVFANVAPGPHRLLVLGDDLHLEYEVIQAPEGSRTTLLLE